jgi:hypothetical protein
MRLLMLTLWGAVIFCTGDAKKKKSKLKTPKPSSDSGWKSAWTDPAPAVEEHQDDEGLQNVQDPSSFAKTPRHQEKDFVSIAESQRLIQFLEDSPESVLKNSRFSNAELNHTTVLSLDALLKDPSTAANSTQSELARLLWDVANRVHKTLAQSMIKESSLGIAMPLEIAAATIHKRTPAPEVPAGWLSTGRAGYPSGAHPEHCNNQWAQN